MTERTRLYAGMHLITGVVEAAEEHERVLVAHHAVPAAWTRAGLVLHLLTW